MTGNAPPISAGKGSDRRHGERQRSAPKKLSFTAALKRQAKVQKALYDVADAASSVTDLQSFYKRMHEIVRELMYAENFFIATYDEQTKLLSFPYFADVVEKQPPTQPLAEFRGMTSWVIRTGETAHHGWDHSNALLAAREISFPDVGTPNQDGIAVPLKADGKTIGALFVQSYTKGIEYTDHDEQVLEFVAQHIGIALTRVRAIEEIRQRNAELDIINGVQAALAAQLDIHGIYEVVGEKLCEIFGYQDVLIYSADLPAGTMTIEYAFENGHKFERVTVPMNSLHEYVVASNATLVFNSNSEQFALQFSDYRVPAGDRPKSFLAVPVPRKKDAGPAVYLVLEDVEGQKVFSNSDVRLLETLAGSMSIALENARLWEQETLFRKALQRELEIGREIQAGFLPESLPQAKGWEIAASLLPAREVGGDFYDAFELPDGNIGLVIADVCDKGVGAALFMTLFRSLIRVTARQEYAAEEQARGKSRSVAGILKSAILLTNNYIAETHEASGMFATLFFGILDPRDGRLTYINGGHEPPLILEGGRVREALAKTGPAVGAIPNGVFDVAQTQLRASNILFACTDGVQDCTDPSGQFFGRDRLLGILEKTGSAACELVETLTSQLRHHINGTAQFDDITLLVVKRQQML